MAEEHRWKTRYCKESFFLYNINFDDPLISDPRPSVEVRLTKFHRTHGFFKDTSVTTSKSSHYLSIWNTHVDGIFNVDGEGHCGFRVVANSLGLCDMDGWRHVRDWMVEELSTNQIFRKDIYGITDFKKLLAIIQCDKDEATVNNRMTLPDMGLIISISFNVMVVVISKSWSFTFPRLRSKPPSEFSSHTIIGISIADSTHFIEIRRLIVSLVSNRDKYPQELLRSRCVNR
ncbi:hypothetical protein Sjap_005267 [Stephania japonica]|uniref:OTU domain-containing protein n=1 Tax=Stephania japonica TaxID=461633 RepID=A0AAP0K563_9MAGN